MPIIDLKKTTTTTYAKLRLECTVIRIHDKQILGLMVQSAVSGRAVLQTYFLINNLDVISTGYLNQNRQRPLFARRRQYERQRIHVQVRCVWFLFQSH